MEKISRSYSTTTRVTYEHLLPNNPINFLMIYKILRRYTGLIGLISSDPLSSKVIMIQEAICEVQGTIAHVFKRKSLSHSVDKSTGKK